MIISRYDQAVVQDNDVGDEWLENTTEFWADEACCKMVIEGRARLGQVRKIDPAFIEEACGCRPGEASAIHDRLKVYLTPEGCAQVNALLFDRIRQIRKAIVAEEWEDPCATYIEEENGLDRGCCLTCLGRFDEALAVLDSSVAGGTDVRAYLCRGRLKWLMKDFPRATADLNHYLDCGQPFRRSSALAWLGESLSGEGRLTAAIGSIEKAISDLASLPPRRPKRANVIASAGVECHFGYGGRPDWEPLDLTEPYVHWISELAQYYGGHLVTSDPDPPEPDYHWLVPDLKAVIGAAKVIDACGMTGHRVRQRFGGITAMLLRYRQKINL